ncbi:hypothetical protein B9479_003502 [Cryptococcus floricola]|uniref:Serine hydrolase domain-containing protein n=1 Tax=Cryptococcus floricola TaxID=2591691 RepID=A0A5D3B0M2_9TREE|nr:hypothetical protein B9479_003502 [Cryptococcus floricola]
MTIRILTLCGFTQNAYIYSKQVGAVRKACKNTEFVFVDPPVVVEKADLPWVNESNLDQFGSSASMDAENQTAETTPRAWWINADNWKTYKRFDDSVKFLHDYMVEHGPFDGVVGFSQGAGMAALLAAMASIEKPGINPLFPAHENIPKLKFAIFIGGFLPGYEPKCESHDFSNYFPLPASLPTLHISGKNDTLIVPERSQILASRCENARFELHDGGHYTPSKASWRHFLNAYINSFAPGGSNGDVPEIDSYGPNGANAPASGGGKGSKSGSNTPTPKTPKQPKQPKEAKPVEGAKVGEATEKEVKEVKGDGKVAEIEEKAAGLSL